MGTTTCGDALAARYQWLEANQCERSVHCQRLCGTCPTAGATNVSRSAGRRPHLEAEGSSSGDRGRWKRNRELGAADHNRGKGVAVKNHLGGRKEVRANCGDDERRRQLC